METAVPETREDTYLRRIKTLFAESQPFALPKTAQCIAYVGSHSHGTYVPPTDPDAIDDVDFMGVVLPPSEYILGGVKSWDHWTCQRDELDIVMYGLHKWVGLLLKGNPNVLGLLWLQPEDYLYKGWAFEQLVKQRELFSSKVAYTSFAGYASGQLQRMTSYSPEIQAEIDTLTSFLEANGWHLSEVMDKRPLPMPKLCTPEEANEAATRLRTLRAKYHAAYMGEKRRRLVVKHGYDTKNAAHLIRLLNMCKGFMETGVLEVRQSPDNAEFLKEIKRGEYKLEHVKALADRLFAETKVARDKSLLPDKPDYEKISWLVKDLVWEQYKYPDAAF